LINIFYNIIYYQKKCIEGGDVVIYEVRLADIVEVMANEVMVNEVTANEVMVPKVGIPDIFYRRTITVMVLRNIGQVKNLFVRDASRLLMKHRWVISFWNVIFPVLMLFYLLDKRHLIV
jgi:hypothetical protein